jgi:cell division protein FtsI (penicillin-binding protein 3)
MATHDLSPQQEMVNRRLPVIVGMMIIMTIVLIASLARYQFFSPDVEREFRIRGAANTNSVRRLPAERGLIYDRSGHLLAYNTIQYSIGISPNLVAQPRTLATELGAILNMDEFAIYNRIANNTAPWVLIASPVSASAGQQILDNEVLDTIAITIEPRPNRFYPQGLLAAQTLGFVIEGDAERGQTGAMGVESSYNDQLAGRVIDQEFSTIPFSPPVDDTEERRGMNVVLTIDRDLQFLAETTLENAIEDTGSTGGTIIIMDPRNGDVLALASRPTFDPNNFIEAQERLLNNPAVSAVYEPGSVFKLFTVASALEKGSIDRAWTYNDQGSLDVGGVTIQNWDRGAHGIVDTTEVLVQSYNVGAAEIALEMGPDDFYQMVRAFGIGQRTGIDLPNESAGLLKVQGIDPEWSESDLATNSFGQGVSTTPMQLISAISAIANRGLMHQPRVVRQIVDGDEVFEADRNVRRAVSPETARQVADMMVRVVEEGATLARLEGYSIAGKTGTAQIPGPTGYQEGPNTTITTFVGFLPADDPVVSILVKLDRPDDYWGGIVAAPVFRQLVERLVILMDIPTDAIRLNLQAQGGDA